MGVGPELVHRRTRNAFRDTCSGCGVVRLIEQAFENEGFDSAPDEAAPPLGWYGPGARRGTFDRYVHTLDWTDPSQVRRALNVFEEILTWVNGEGTEKTREQLVRHLHRDGYAVDEQGRIRSSTAAGIAALPLHALRDPAAILEHLDRIAGAMDVDPAVAISGAKALVEATTKRVLDETGESYDERDDVPALVKAAQKALQLHPGALAPTAKGVESTKRILSALSQIAINLAELRNEYGPDHGRTHATAGIHPRHAHLAVGAATTYCRMLLETLEGRQVPATWD